mmetsp:Transcript_43757/g.58039  ORF Transcript_43757/g.58039 Transcript_43757/m.58039 type:complete len:101 (+) Transcript_43757:3073-3375(+)
MYLLNDLSRTPEDFLTDKPEGEERQATKADENGEEPKDDAKEDKAGGGEGDALVEPEGEKKQDEPEKFVRPALFDRFVQCKMVGLILIFTFWGFAIFLSI